MQARRGFPDSDNLTGQPEHGIMTPSDSTSALLWPKRWKPVAANFFGVFRCRTNCLHLPVAVTRIDCDELSETS